MDEISFSELGAYLKKKRLTAGLQQVEVAKTLKCSPQFVANWERGASSPPMSLLPHLLDMYSINKSEFMKMMAQIQQSYWKRNLFKNSKKKSSKLG